MVTGIPGHNKGKVLTKQGYRWPWELPENHPRYRPRIIPPPPICDLCDRLAKIFYASGDKRCNVHRDVDLKDGVAWQQKMREGNGEEE